MNENEDVMTQNEEDERPLVLVRTGASNSAFVFTVATVALLAAGGDYFAGDRQQGRTNTERICEMQAVRSQSDAQKAAAETQSIIQKRIGEIQEQVAKTCADRGDVPQFLNGNVICNVRPKEGK